MSLKVGDNETSVSYQLHMSDIDHAVSMPHSTNIKHKSLEPWNYSDTRSETVPKYNFKVCDVPNAENDPQHEQSKFQITKISDWRESHNKFASKINNYTRDTHSEICEKLSSEGLVSDFTNTSTIRMARSAPLVCQNIQMLQIL